MNSALTAFSIHKTYPSVSRRGDGLAVLTDISLTVDRGEMVALVGPSGSGKSTLMYCLSGLEPVTGGTVTIDGVSLHDLNGTAMAKFRREKIGFVFQAYNLIPSLTALDNVALPLRLRQASDASARAFDALSAVGLSDRIGHSPGELSGGQQQRVAVARALAAHPSIVFADEPTGSLDTRAGDEVLALLRELAGGNSSVVMATHSAEAAALADRVVVVVDGRVREELVGATADAIAAAVSRSHSVVSA